MPTGYTAAVGDGKITEFPEFVWSCARAFGALIMMRDDPMDAQVPQAFTPDTKYYDEMIAAARLDLVQLPLLSYAACVSLANADHERAAAEHAKRAVTRRDTKARYEGMLAKARAWEPPSPDHVGLRDFMIEQLGSSINFDCSGSYDTPPVHLTGEQWREQALQKAARDLKYGTERRDKEIERTAGRNEWLKALRASLAQGTETRRAETPSAPSRSDDGPVGSADAP